MMILPPAIRANSAIPNPMGPAPATSTNSPSLTSALRTACAPIANGSTNASSSHDNPSPFNKDDAGTDKYSANPPCTCTPHTFICTQQLGSSDLQAIHCPQL